MGQTVKAVDTSRELLRAALSMPGTQAQLVARTGLPARTVSNLLRGMAERCEAHLLTESRGRSPSVWAGGPAPAIDGDDDDSNEAERRDIEASRAWLRTWKPRRDALVCSMFGAGPAQQHDLAKQMATE